MTSAISLITILLLHSLLLHALPQRLNASNIDSSLEPNTNTSLKARLDFEDLVLRSFHTIGTYDTAADALVVKATPGSSSSSRPRGSSASDFNIIRTTGIDGTRDRLITTHNLAGHPDSFYPPVGTPVRPDAQWGRKLHPWTWYDMGHTLGHAIDELRRMGYTAEWSEVRLLFPTTDFITGSSKTELWYAFLRSEASTPVWTVYATHSGRTGLYTGDIAGGLMGSEIKATE